MYRIAHISDLHLVAQAIKADHTILEKLASAISEKAGLKIEANPYSTQRLDALKIAMDVLQPSAIFITGDLTNYGDEESMKFAAQVVEELRTAAGGDPVTYIVPGNHDTLTERMKTIDQDPSWRARVVRAVKRMSPELAITSRLAERLRGEPVDGEPHFLSTFWKFIPAKYRPVDPAQPQFIDMRWGEAAVFLFNSNVDETFMANKGSIGNSYTPLHGALQKKEMRDRLAAAMKIALLHHHPISAPQAIDPDVERFYNWMDDGPRFLQYLNEQRFTLVAHGHQHQPFICTINYRREDDRPLHIVAAGSATQAGGPASFNLIDILSPFEVRVQRFDYQDPEFVPHLPSMCRLPVRSAKSIRLTAENEAERAEDTAVRNLMRSSDDSYDSDIEYSEIDYRVTITEKQRYIADYRRAGTVRGRAGQAGTKFVITGSPPMTKEQMNLHATDSQSNEANCQVLLDEGVRKVICVSPKGKQLKINDTFDVTLHFEWQADEREPNDFDAFNLMNIRYPVGHFIYQVTYPWTAAKIAVKEFVLELKDAEVHKIDDDTKKTPGSTVLTIDFGAPRPVAYLIYFSETLRPWL
jgi:UDP-2,3-diacylglucosamine pyrophosphatase LpxH